MYTYLEIASGSNKGMVYRLQPSLRLGSSSQCEIPILDSDAPPIHSVVMYDHKDQLVLVCTNAVYEILANNKKVKKTVLYQGKLLQISNTHLRIRVSETPLIGAIDPLTLKQSETQNNPPPTTDDVFEIDDKSRVTVFETTKSLLIKELQALVDSFNTPYPHPKTFKLFKQPIRLKVESGPQADDEYWISWGPRDFGPQSLEFQLEFPPFPPVLFTLSSNNEGEIIFSTNHPAYASLSGQTSSTSVISDGSKILAGNSTISVEFVKSDGGNHDQS